MRSRALQLCRTVGLVILAFSMASPAAAQREFNLGVSASSLAPRDGGTSHGGGTLSLGWLSGTTSETDFFITRWNDVDFGTSQQGITTYGIDNKYFPVEASGVAPFLTTGIGLFRYTLPGGLLTSPSKEWGFVSSMGLGLGTTLGDHFWLGGEGRLRVDNGQRSTEYRLSGSYGFGPLRAARSKPGTIAPFALGIARLGHGPYHAATPYAGIRFRRDETRHGSAAVDVGVAGLDNDDPTPLRVTAWIVQPAAEYGWTASWGRPYLEFGPQMVGFAGGVDDGMRVGLHTGGGADLRLGESMELGLVSRVTWFQSADGRHQFGLQLGASIGPRLMRDRSGLPAKLPPETH